MSSTLLDLPALNATQAELGLSESYQFYSTRELIAPLLDDHWEVTQASQVRSKTYNPDGKHLVRLSHPKLQLGEQRLEALVMRKVLIVCFLHLAPFRSQLHRLINSSNPGGFFIEMQSIRPAQPLQSRITLSN